MSNHSSPNDATSERKKKSYFTDGNERNPTREINNDLYLQNKNLLVQENFLQKQVECLTSLLGASLADQKLIKQSLEK